VNLVKILPLISFKDYLGYDYPIEEALFGDCMTFLKGFLKMYQLEIIKNMGNNKMRSKKNCPYVALIKKKNDFHVSIFIQGIDIFTGTNNFKSDQIILGYLASEACSEIVEETYFFMNELKIKKEVSNSRSDLLTNFDILKLINTDNTFKPEDDSLDYPGYTTCFPYEIKSEYSAFNGILSNKIKILESVMPGFYNVDYHIALDVPFEENDFLMENVYGNFYYSKDKVHWNMAKLNLKPKCFFCKHPPVASVEYIEVLKFKSRQGYTRNDAAYLACANSIVNKKKICQNFWKKNSGKGLGAMKRLIIWLKVILYKFGFVTWNLKGKRINTVLKRFKEKGVVMPLDLKVIRDEKKKEEIRLRNVYNKFRKIKVSLERYPQQPKLGFIKESQPYYLLNIDTVLDYNYEILNPEVLKCFDVKMALDLFNYIRINKSKNQSKRFNRFPFTLGQFKNMLANKKRKTRYVGYRNFVLKMLNKKYNLFNQYDYKILKKLNQTSLYSFTGENQYKFKRSILSRYYHNDKTPLELIVGFVEFVKKQRLIFPKYRQYESYDMNLEYNKDIFDRYLGDRFNSMEKTSKFYRFSDSTSPTKIDLKKIINSKSFRIFYDRSKETDRINRIYDSLKE